MRFLIVSMVKLCLVDVFRGDIWCNCLLEEDGSFRDEKIEESKTGESIGILLSRSQAHETC
jgi:hypothetical protein